MTQHTYKFLGYLSNGKGIRFGDVSNDGNTLRVDHSQGFAPGSTKLNPLVVRRGSITINDRIKHTVEGCDPCSASYIPRVISIQFSGHDPASLREGIKKLNAVVEAVIADLTKGFLPTTSDIVVSTEPEA